MAECSWNDCSEEAVTEVALDYGQEVCETCGTAKTNKMVFAMCETHRDQFGEAGSDSSVLIINATGAMT